MENDPCIVETVCKNIGNDSVEYKTYPKIKESGIEWIGKIPKHWKIIPFNHMIKLIHGYAFKSEEFVEKGIPVIKIEQVKKNGKIDLNNCNFFPLSKKQQLIDYFVSTGDILMALTGATVGKVAVVQKGIQGLQNQRVGRMISKNTQKFTNKNIFYLISSNFFQKQIEINLNQSSQPNIGTNDLSKIKLVISNNIIEQQKICELLDHNIILFENLISKCRLQIDLLQEKKMTLIDRVVTRGLENGYDTKKWDSVCKVEIPKHWDIIPFKYILNKKMDNGIFKKKDQYGEGIRLVNVGDIYQENGIINQKTLVRVRVDNEELKKYIISENEIFFVRSSLKLEGIGISSIIKNIEEPMVYECHVIRTKPNSSKINSDYLKYLLNSSKIRSYLISISQTVTMTTISQDHIKNIKIICPSLKEQDKIVNYIQEQNIFIDKIISKLQSQLEKIQEGKQSFLTSVITGKICVTN